MPIMNGLEVMDKLQQTEVKFNIIMISGDSSIEAEALAKGAMSFIEKPVDIINLCNLLP